MSVVNSAISLRDGMNNSTANLVEAANLMHNLIIQSGMVQVAPDEYTGQALIFSETAGAGLTQVTRGGEIRDYVIGYKVYKHPFLNLYLKVNYIDVRQGGSYTNFLNFSYQIAKELRSGGFNPIVASPVFTGLSYSYGNQFSDSVPTEVLPAGAKPITISCGPDHFWVASEHSVKVNPASGKATTPMGYLDPLAFGLFSSQNNNDVLCVALSQNISGGGQYGFSGTNLSGVNHPGIRYFASSNGAWVERANCAAGFLIDPIATSTINGIRVTQADLIINSEQHRFGFGFINAGVLPSSEIISINLTGVRQNYKHLPGFGSAGPILTDTPKSSCSTVLFPLAG